MFSINLYDHLEDTRGDVLNTEFKNGDKKVSNENKSEDLWNNIKMINSALKLVDKEDSFDKREIENGDNVQSIVSYTNLEEEPDNTSIDKDIQSKDISTKNQTNGQDEALINTFSIKLFDHLEVESKLILFSTTKFP